MLYLFYFHSEFSYQHIYLLEQKKITSEFKENASTYCISLLLHTFIKSSVVLYAASFLF